MDSINVIASHSETDNNIVVMPLSPSNHPIDLESFDLDEALAVAGESCRQFAASKTFVSNLPAVEDVTVVDVCSVCMESFGRHNSISDGGNKRIPCGHVYHSNCITLWLSYSNSCPLCRRHISLHFHCN